MGDGDLKGLQPFYEKILIQEKPESERGDRPLSEAEREQGG